MPRDDDESPKMGEFETTRARWIEDDYERQALRGIRRRVGPEEGNADLLSKERTPESGVNRTEEVRKRTMITDESEDIDSDAGGKESYG